MISQDQIRSPRPRVARLIFLGILLLIAFLMPIVNVQQTSGKATYEAVLVNIEILGQDDASTGLKLFMLFPGIAGIAVILIALFLPAPSRSISLIVTGAVGLLLLLLVVDEIGDDKVQTMLMLTLGSKTWAILLGMAATALLLGGSRARWFAGECGVAGTLAAVGGGLAILGYVLPSMPDDSLPVGAPFELMDTDDGTFLGAVLLLATVMVVAAAILAFVNLKRRGSVTAAKLGNTSFWLVVGSMLVLFLGVWVFMLSTIGDRVEGMTAPLSIGILKWASLTMGITLLLPLGLSDLLASRHAGSSPAKAGATPAAGTGWSRPTQALGEGAERDLAVQRQIHEIMLLRDEGHLTEEEFQSRREALEDLL